MKICVRRIAAIVLCLCFALQLVAVPTAEWMSPFARFLAYVQGKLSPPWSRQSKLSPPIPSTQSKLAPPWPVAPPSDTSGLTVPASDTTETTVAPTPP